MRDGRDVRGRREGRGIKRGGERLEERKGGREKQEGMREDGEETRTGD